jgi:type 1 glutamine amidotransferase
MLANRVANNARGGSAWPRMTPTPRMMRRVFVAAIVLVGCAWLTAQQPPANPGRGGAPLPPGQNPNGMRVYIRAGLKSHGPGKHDYPQFLADWSKLLTEHGAVVDGSFHSPTAAELEHTDVVVIYKGDAGYLTEKEKSDLEAYVRRGGGLVAFHDSLCGPDPEYFANLVGGAKKHGETNFTLEAEVPYTIVDRSNPIMQGMSDFMLKEDEAFYLMTWATKSKINVLATAVMAKTPTAVRAGHAGEVVPQIWTYEHTLEGGTASARAFVWMQGHEYANFSDPVIKPMLLRGIAWAAKKPVNELVDYKPPVRAGRSSGK